MRVRGRVRGRARGRVRGRVRVSVLMATSCGTPDTGAGRCRARESSYRAVLICMCVCVVCYGGCV